VVVVEEHMKGGEPQELVGSIGHSDMAVVGRYHEGQEVVAVVAQVLIGWDEVQGGQKEEVVAAAHANKSRTYVTTPDKT